MKNYRKVQVVHSLEVDTLFKKLGLNEEFINKKLKCECCEDIIQSNNFKLAAKINNKLVFVCDKGSCYEKFLINNCQEKQNG